ncbi:hypoxanthine phosphoribosyltransferase [Vicingaceae bacterium]|nr:hypoxanthine phosphoribosyltransferase [Vicingaceae bacterium]
MKEISVLDKTFKRFKNVEEINTSIKVIAEKINKDYEGKTPLFLGVLNGCFLFAADLLREITLDCEVSFVKVASYKGMKSTGEVNQLIGLDRSLEDRDVIIIEDIVDTGNTIENIVELLTKAGCNSIKIATFLLKPEAYKKSIKVDYVAMEIANKFVVGYGLDYDGFGRNVKELYVLKD